MRRIVIVIIVVAAVLAVATVVFVGRVALGMLFSGAPFGPAPQ